eukprot:s411_g11.t1
MTGVRFLDVVDAAFPGETSRADVELRGIFTIHVQNETPLQYLEALQKLQGLLSIKLLEDGDRNMALMCLVSTVLTVRPSPGGAAPGTLTAWAAPEETEKSGEGRRREITRRVGSLTRGGVFGTLSGLSAEEPFTVMAESATVEVLYINSEAKQRLPRMVVDMLREYVSRSTMFRLGNLKVNRATDLKRKQTRVAPSFPLIGTLFPTSSKDWSTMSKVSHASEVEEDPATKQFAIARARLLGSSSSPALSKEPRLRSKAY